MRILFLFVHNWDKEIADFQRGAVPSHRLWGYAEMAAQGAEAVHCPLPQRFGKWFKKPHLWRAYQTLWTLLHQRDLDCLVAVNEASALPVLALKRLGLIRTPIVVLGNALLHSRNCTGGRKALWKWLLPAAESVVSLASAQTAWVAEEFGLKPERMAFIPMPLDTAYFQRHAVAEPPGDFCLSVGTNDGKDYLTLLKAFPKNERLIIVTDAYNAALVEQHRAPDAQVEVRQAVPIKELRTLYGQARLLIIPLAKIRSGSGHTVLLENMALGKAVVVSNTAGMRDYVEHGVTALVVEPGDAAQLGATIREYLAEPARFAHLGPNAAAWARDYFSSVKFAEKLLAEIRRITGGRAASAVAVPSTHRAGAAAPPLTPVK